MAVKRDAHVILAVHVTDRLKKVPSVQTTLTQYGDVIRTRLGLHEVSKDFSAPGGILILDIVSDARARMLQKALDKIKGIETKLVVFKH
ncbi:MAG: putative iron-only hydrogenase system regulator [Acidobacteria bacterium]|nr:putative iron-only hydrogenase system regulator [Acidobacteriota bacterium]